MDLQKLYIYIYLSFRKFIQKWNDPLKVQIRRVFYTSVLTVWGFQLIHQDGCSNLGGADLAGGNKKGYLREGKDFDIKDASCCYYRYSLQNPTEMLWDLPWNSSPFSFAKRCKPCLKKHHQTFTRMAVQAVSGDKVFGQRHWLRGALSIQTSRDMSFEHGLTHTLSKEANSLVILQTHRLPTNHCQKCQCQTLWLKNTFFARIQQWLNAEQRYFFGPCQATEICRQVPLQHPHWKEVLRQL